MTDEETYVYDNCYYLNREFNFDTDNSTLDDFITTNFNTSVYPILNGVSACKNQAEQNNKDFFLTSDLSNDNTEYNYTCYVPKANSSCDISDITEIANPYNNILTKLLGDDNIRQEYRLTSDYIGELTNNSVNTTNKNIINSKPCIKYINSENTQPNSHFGSKVYSGENQDRYKYNTTFALYKTNLILNNSIESAEINMNQKYETHKNNFETNFDNNRFTTHLEDLRIAFNNYICQENLEQTTFDEKLRNLASFYDTMSNNLDDITTDISRVRIFTQYSLRRLSTLEQEIKIEKKKLKDLLGFDGASNGKLIDTKYLKNIKLTETIILSLIIIFLIYFYAKKK